MRAFTSDSFVLPLPEKHRFPMMKYRRLRERVMNELPAVQLLPSAPVDRAQLEAAHDCDYVERVLAQTLTEREIRVIGFPQVSELAWRARHSTGATLAAARAALEDGTAANLAGGTHHASPAMGQGYCLFNDASIAIRALQNEGHIRRALVVDLDVHQGNGTALCHANDPTVFTFSVHGGRNFPFRKEASDLDIPLPDGTTDAEYLQTVEDALQSVFARFVPDLVVYNAGVDVFEGDRLGRLSLSAEGVAARDRLVFDQCRSRGLPVAVTMGGGYAPDVEQIVGLHLQTIATAARG